MKNGVMCRRIRVIALMLAVILLVMPTVSAAESEMFQPRASIYLDSYQTYIYPAGGGEIQVWFDVTATNYMDELGSLSIFLYESTDNANWTHVETFSHVDNANMLLEDDIFHMSHVTYQGVRGRYYKAYVCIWAGKDGGGDSRYLWTSAKIAT